VDLRQRERVKATVKSLLADSPFEAVLHLAGISSIWNSFSDPVLMFEVNLMGTVHLLQALTDEGWRGRLLFVSSGAVYGDPDRVLVPLHEDSPLAPSSPYAASKAAGEHAVLEWGRRGGGSAVVARSSNHAGPGQSSHFFLPSMARQMTAVPRGESVVVETGNLTPYRDFLHVDDVVDAYQALLERGQDGTVYNVARGQSSSLSQVLEGLCAASGRKVQTQVRSERFRAEPSRPLEISVQRIVEHTGWTPIRGLEQLYCDLISFWEAKHEEDRVDHGGFGSRRGLS
jgi:GDP-4-dehydro-6-deoxy-D-mannose reductase